jgi:hypothetical protein
MFPILKIGSKSASTIKRITKPNRINISGSMNRTAKSNARQFRFSIEVAISTKTESNVFDSSATEIISTTARGKQPDFAKGPAKCEPPLMFSDASRIAADKILLPAAPAEISNDLTIGTPLRKSVPNTLQNRATAKPS